MKIKRELISRRFAPAVLVNRNNRHKFGDYGRLFLFLAVVILITIFMIIVNVQDHADQIQQKAANLQQIT